MTDQPEALTDLGLIGGLIECELWTSTYAAVMGTALKGNCS